MLKLEQEGHSECYSGHFRIEDVDNGDDYDEDNDDDENDDDDDDDDDGGGEGMTRLASGGKRNPPLVPPSTTYHSASYSPELEVAMMMRMIMVITTMHCNDKNDEDHIIKLM